MMEFPSWTTPNLQLASVTNFEIPSGLGKSLSHLSLAWNSAIGPKLPIFVMALNLMKNLQSLTLTLAIRGIQPGAPFLYLFCIAANALCKSGNPNLAGPLKT